MKHRVMLLNVLLMAFSVLLFSSARAEAVVFNGSLQQGSLLIGQLEPHQQVEHQGIILPLTDTGQFLLGLDRDHPSELVLTFIGQDGVRNKKVFDVVSREYRIQRIEGIARNIMSPNKVALTRISVEHKQVVEARAELSQREDFLTTFQWPLIGRITGVYGSQRVYNGVYGRPHYGVDVAGPVGATVVAPAAGRVVMTHKNMFYSGGTVIIDHGHGLNSTFLHLSKILVQPGQELQSGEVVAEVGATGRVTGPHLDWRMNWRSQRVDPQRLVPPMP